MKKFNAWKAKSNCDPIEGTDRLFTGNSKRDVLQHLAYEEGVEHNRNDMVVILPNGDMWCVSQL